MFDGGRGRLGITTTCCHFGILFAVILVCLMVEEIEQIGHFIL